VRLKLDENIGRRGLELVQSAGHDVMTVYEQGLSGASDERIFQVCADEQRALITLDHDFGQVLRFPPKTSHGIVILELPGKGTTEELLNRLREFLAVLAVRPLGRELWIVETGRIRVHQA
jgi:predicted nuclease of predicted toxin-antitoxin system